MSHEIGSNFEEFELCQFNNSMREYAISFSSLVKFRLTTMAEPDQWYSIQPRSSIIPQLVSEIYIIR